MAEKGENTDNKVGPDINYFRGNLARRFPLGKNKDEKFGAAMANNQEIIEIARTLRALGDFDIEQNYKVRVEEVAEREFIRQVSVENSLSSCLRKVFETLDIVLEWLERSAQKAKDEAAKMDKIQPRPQTERNTNDIVGGQTQSANGYQEKKESVLRGLFHITELGSYTWYVGLLELACKFLDLPDNPYAAKRDYVQECLREVQEQKVEVSELVEKACEILQDITRDDQFNQSKATEFNSIVRQADLIFESCNVSLSDANETIDELIKIMSTIKIFSRVLRIAGFGATCYGLYHMSPSSSTMDNLASYIPSTALSLIKNLFLNLPMKYITFGATCAVSGYAWLSLLPSRTYKFLDDLTELKLKHKTLTRQINHLDRKLKNAIKDFDDTSKQKSNCD